MSGTLYAPDAERVATTNAWAFLHWARIAGGWPELIAWSRQDPRAFASALGSFLGSRDDPSPQPPPARGGGDLTPLRTLPLPLREGLGEGLPVIASTILHADLRPDDRVLLAGSWHRPPGEGTVLIDTPGTDLLAECAAHAATVLIAPAPNLAALARPHPGPRPDLSVLRTVVALGSPMPPEARARLYTWVKPDILLLAQAGDLLWGSPLDPVPRELGPPFRFFHP